MSEHIVHTAVVEDSFAICLGLPDVSDDFRKVMTDHAKFAGLGSITVAGDAFSTRLLDEYRQKWNERDDKMEARLAFVLGWISHRACDRTMKPLWVEPPMKIGSDVDPNISPKECSVYHEGFIYNKYYSHVPEFHYCIFPEDLKDLPGIKLINHEIAGMFIQQSFGVNYMAIQTLPNDGEDQEWFEKICKQAQKFYVDMMRYHRSAGNPDPDYTKEFLTDINWFDESDAIVRLALDLRDGKKVSEQAYIDAMGEEPTCHYGKALHLSIKYIMAASNYFKNIDTSLNELREQLDIGKLGPGGQGV